MVLLNCNNFNQLFRNIEKLTDSGGQIWTSLTYRIKIHSTHFIVLLIVSQFLTLFLNEFESPDLNRQAGQGEHYWIISQDASGNSAEVVYIPVCSQDSYLSFPLQICFITEEWQEGSCC